MKILAIYYSSRTRSFLLDSIIFFFTFCVHKLESAQFTVTGPGHPVIAMAGEDTVLPCRLSPRMSAENMEVRWYRSDFTSIVHLYQRGKDEYGQQMSEYRGRTELFEDDIAYGAVDLGILRVRHSDEGQYHCFVQDGAFHAEAVLELKVAAVGSVPRISVDSHQDGGIRVVCQSFGWYPAPDVLWRDFTGQPLSSSTEMKSEEEHGLLEIKSTIITKNSNKNLSCSVRNVLLRQEKESITFYLSDSFFPRASPWMVAWSMTVMILSVVICLTFFLFKLKGKHLDTISKLRRELEWRRSLGDAVNVTLDPDTAHPRLILSEGGKSVRCADTRQRLPDNPQRFDVWPCVLGCEGFTSGRHYWEVEVGGGLYGAVGVARESVSGKGEISLSPEGGGIWAVGRCGDQHWALTCPEPPLSLSQAPRRIRVCLDCDRGQVTFIDAGAEAPIFTYPPGSIPGGRIRPWLCVLPGSQLRLCP
ncbi:butyrophilin subfamily 1 member A1-like isoform X2 [Carettochelys insculpta]|uniref:butyrophilin subfamily 1 member A1-like isoform X2 n=1 Tax=Carettochelys insculpta TaxID=44489 RepID=UPI003EB6C713